MAYNVAIPITLPETMTGKSLRIQFFDPTNGSNIGSELTTGFVEIGSGWYSWQGSAPDGIAGFKIREVAQTKVWQVGSLNPAEVQYVDAAVSSRATPAQVATEISDALRVDTLPELGIGTPAATPTVSQALMLLYMALRDRMDTTATAIKLYNDAGQVIAQAALTDDGTTFTRSELA